MLDRTIAPEAQPITSVNILPIEKIIMPNEVQLNMINTSTQPIVRFEIVFEAGNRFESKIGQSYFTTKMLAEGTKNFTAKQIAEKFAELGYFVEFNQGAERCLISLNGLTKHLNKALKILKDVLDNSIFPEKELENLKTITKQNLLINLEKTAYIASQTFKEKLFGANHYIGKSMSVVDIDQISQQDVIEFYQQYIKNKKYKIFIAGKIEQKEIDSITELFGTELLGELVNVNKNKSKIAYEGTTSIIEKPNALQSSLRIGRRIIERKHPDYFKFLVCNTIFGGYFGSRLMKNIREDKGFTYGISSQYLPINDYSYFMISTDVKKEYTKSTIEEISNEINELKSILVPETELEVVKNFLVGDFAGSFNTPFEIVDKYKVLIFEELNIDFYDTFIENISKVTALDILNTAKKYLNINEMLEVVVGGL